MDECKPLVEGVEPGREPADGRRAGRDLHSSTFQLNLSALYGIGDLRRACVARVMGYLGVFRVCRVASCD